MTTTVRVAGDAAARRWPATALVTAAGTALLAALVLLSCCRGSTGVYPLSQTLQGALALLGICEPLAGAEQIIVEMRVFRTLVTVGVGAALALSGALLQGVFRNDLAAPSILGISAGASLGATLAILTIGGYGPLLMLQQAAGFGPLLVTVASFAGAAAITWFVMRLATGRGGLSVPTLLLVGVAINAMIGGVQAAIQSFVLQDFEVARAVFAWGFGTLDDRTGIHVLLILGAVTLAAFAIPAVATELDLLAPGEQDARALGVNVRRVQTLALLAAALAAGAAVAVAGQIAFVGLVVPHLLRLLVGRGHRRLLGLCLLAGPILVLGCDFLQRWLLGREYLKPGVLMSLIGGPFFLLLLVKNKNRMVTW